VKLATNLVLAFFLLFTFPSVAHGSIIFQDNFDDGNANGWITLQNNCLYNGSPSTWQVVNGKVGIKINSGGDCYADLLPNDLTWNSTINDYSVEFDMTLVEGTDHHFAFRYSNPFDWYNIHIQSPNHLILQRVLNTEIYNNFVIDNFSNGQTIHFRIDILGEHIKIFIGNPPRLILDYPNAGGRFPTGRIALQATSGSDPYFEKYFDNIVVRTIDSGELAVPLLKQTAEPWQDDLYDSADKWSPDNSTINAYGCAITSAAMVFQYHGLTKMPDNSVLDPGTLNSWLKSQSDGYVGEGLVNWLALARLSKKAKQSGNNPQFGYNALEFKRVNGENKTLLTEDLNNSRPDILRVPGHFVVAKGITGTTFSINDPFYSRNTLSDSYNNTFSYMGRFIPSNTDLSYMLLLTGISTEATIEDEDGSVISTESIEEPITNAQDNIGTNTLPVKLVYNEQPESGSYIIKIVHNTTGSYNLKAFLYDENGDPYQVVLAGIGNVGELESYSVTFDKLLSNQSSLVKQVTFNSVRTDIDELYSLGHISSDSSKNNLHRRLNRAEEYASESNSTATIRELGHMLDSINRESGKRFDLETQDVLRIDIESLLKSL
jgi:hypothetical protein